MTPRAGFAGASRVRRQLESVSLDEASDVLDALDDLARNGDRARVHLSVPRGAASTGQPREFVAWLPHGWAAHITFKRGLPPLPSQLLEVRALVKIWKGEE